VNGPAPNGSLSWRDIYRAVEASEAKITTRLDAMASLLITRLEKHDEEIRDIQDRNLRQEARDKSVVEILGRGRTALLLGFSAVGAALAILDALSRL
jgi:hypothetical protein